MKHVKLPSIRPSIFSSSQQRSPLPPPNGYVSSPTSVSISAALQHYINSDFPFHGQKIHSHILKSGFMPNTNVSIKLLIVHLKSCCLRYARQMFDEMPQPTLSAYNYMINGHLKHRQIEDLLILVSRLTFSGEKPDGFTFSMILKATSCASGGVFALPYCLEKVVHAQILRTNIEPDDVLYTALVDSYVKNGKVGYARRVFDMMLEKNVICSTSLISGYMSQGSVEDAEDIFRRTVEKDVVVFNSMIEGYSRSVETARRSLEVYIDMQRLNFRPTMSTFASVIGACSILTAYEIGQQVESQLVKMDFSNDIKMASALVDMYSKCGRIEDARRVFDHMPEKNVFTWTSMIDGYGKNGYPLEALELFSRMQLEHHVKPNYVTFLSALSACGHAGLVAKGWTIFESMERDYMLKPRMEHYACMVDLLGRAGSLQQAWEFVMRMPEKPGSDVWAALLSSCQLHGDLEMASVAANEIFKLKSDSRPGAYVALSNALAAAGKWDSVSEVRQLMKVRGVSKDIGRSWVGADGGP